MYSTTFLSKRIFLLLYYNVAYLIFFFTEVPATMYDSLDFNYTECNSIAASTDEIIWSDDETIVADQETVWQEGKSNFIFKLPHV